MEIWEAIITGILFNIGLFLTIGGRKENRKFYPRYMCHDGDKEIIIGIFLLIVSAGVGVGFLFM